MSVPFQPGSVPKNGTKQTARHSRAHKANGTVPCRCAVPFCPPDVPLSMPVEIHGIACLLDRSGAGYVVTLRASGQRIAAAPTRFLAVARAALNLAPARAFANNEQGGA